VPTSTSISLEEEHRALSTGAGVLARPDRAHVVVRGPETFEYLQGQVTNDVAALSPCGGCYAALLNPKGRILADMRVIARSPEEAWLELEEVARETVLRELSMYRIGRKVEIADATAERTTLSVIGPRARDIVLAAGVVAQPPPDNEHGWVAAGDDGVAVATDAGVDVLLAPSAVAAAREALERAGAVAVSAPAAELARIERGRPRYGVDFTDENLPGEAGIVERAVSFTKGCYVGQEPVARMFHKGRPNRHLRGLALSAPVEAGTPVAAAGKEVGRITSSGVSPRHGPIALAILRREVQPGDEVATGAGASARVVDLPFA
jgi:folate-binding protein YgfZ